MLQFIVNRDSLNQEDLSKSEILIQTRNSQLNHKIKEFFIIHK